VALKKNGPRFDFRSELRSVYGLLLNSRPTAKGAMWCLKVNAVIAEKGEAFRQAHGAKRRSLDVTLAVACWTGLETSESQGRRRPEARGFVVVDSVPQQAGKSDITQTSIGKTSR
jgi:hypothetical protein